MRGERGERVGERGADAWDPHADVSKTTMKTGKGVICPVLRV